MFGNRDTVQDVGDRGGHKNHGFGQRKTRQVRNLQAIGFLSWDCGGMVTKRGVSSGLSWNEDVNENNERGGESGGGSE